MRTRGPRIPMRRPLARYDLRGLARKRMEPLMPFFKMTFALIFPARRIFFPLF